MFDRFARIRNCEFAYRIVRRAAALHRGRRDETGNRLGTRAIALQTASAHALDGQAVLGGHMTRTRRARIGGKSRPAADGQVCVSYAGAACRAVPAPCRPPVRRRSGRSSTCRRSCRAPADAPLASTNVAEMIARNAAGKAVVAGRQRPHAGEAEDDLFSAECDDRGKHESERLQDIIAARPPRSAPCPDRRRGYRSSRPAPCRDRETGCRCARPRSRSRPCGRRARRTVRVVDDQMRALGAAHQRLPPRAPIGLVGQVDPAAGGVDDQLRLAPAGARRSASSSDDQAVAGRRHLRIVQRARSGSPTDRPAASRCRAARDG